jgi:hypothetical protein
MNELYKLNVEQLKKHLEDFTLDCDNQIKELLKNKTECIIDGNTQRHSYFVRNIPSTDRDIKINNKCNFLWFRDILDMGYFNSSKFFRLDRNGEIDTTGRKENYNLYLDNYGFLGVRGKDKYGEYSEFWECKLNCYYNDINYINLKKQREKRITEAVIKDKQTS